MDNFNYQFYEEFTKLDKACVSVYQAEGGTLGYLAQMRNVSDACADVVPRWNADLEQLHRYRTVYRALVQSKDAFEESLCTQKDVDWIRDFHARIMERKDPLALLQLLGYRAEDDAKHRMECERTDRSLMSVRHSRDRHGNGTFGVWVILGAVLLTCLICAFALTRT